MLSNCFGSNKTNTEMVLSFAGFRSCALTAPESGALTFWLFKTKTNKQCFNRVSKASVYQIFWLNIGLGLNHSCPERSWNLHHLRYSNLSWAWTWATWTGWTCFDRWLYQMTPSCHFHHKLFCDSVKEVPLKKKRSKWTKYLTATEGHCCSLLCLVQQLVDSHGTSAAGLRWNYVLKLSIFCLIMDLDD